MDILIKVMKQPLRIRFESPGYTYSEYNYISNNSCFFQLTSNVRLNILLKQANRQYLIASKSDQSENKTIWVRDLSKSINKKNQTFCNFV